MFLAGADTVTTGGAVSPGGGVAWLYRLEGGGGGRTLLPLPPYNHPYFVPPTG